MYNCNNNNNNNKTPKSNNSNTNSKNNCWHDQLNNYWNGLTNMNIDTKVLSNWIDEDRLFVTNWKFDTKLNAFRIWTDLPGCNKSSTLIDFNKGRNEITVTSKRIIDDETISIKRSMFLPKDVDPTTIKASLEDGVLTITVNKALVELEKSIKINIS
jgi:HSP20 family molecular chaperone IbpA